MMTNIEWKEIYEVGNLEIDSEHKVFVRIIQKIQNFAEKVEKDGDHNKKHLERLVVELLKYAEFHFCSEENVMLEIEYPGIFDHKHEHEKLLAELRNLIFAFEMNKQDIDELITFLTDWFIKHTVKEDKNLAQSIKKSLKL